MKDENQFAFAILQRMFFLFALLILFEKSYSQISENVSLFAQLKPDTSTAGRYTGCWGYVSPAGNEYAIVGGHNGTFTIDITDSTNVRLVSFVPGTEADWRELK